MIRAIQNLSEKIKIQYREKDIAYEKIHLQALEALCKMNQLTFF